MPSHEDANLILRLYELRREEKMRTARAWFVANYYPQSFEDAMKISPMGSEENAYVRMVTSYWEMVASFIANGVLNEELFFQSGGELLLTWVRIQPLAAGMRSAFQNPMVWKNLETVASKQIAYMNREAPGAYEAFAARMGKKPETKA